MQPPLARIGPAVLIFFTLSSATLAGETKRGANIPSIDPPDRWHIITEYRVTTESRCLGDTRRAQCTIETLLACTLGYQDELDQPCIAAADDKLAYEWYFNREPKMAATPPMISYQVVKVGRVGSAPTEVGLTDPERAPKSGDLFVLLRIRACWTNDPKMCNPWRWSSFSYYLREIGGRWLILNYAVGKPI